MKKVLSFIVVIILALVETAHAGLCYSDVEAEAEQGIRIHSELMVIGLNCQHMGARYDMDLYKEYREFTVKHADLFAKYEDILLSFFAKRGDQKPEVSLNTLRTDFANKISNDSAAMRPDIFCARYAQRIEKVSVMRQVDLRKWASTIYPQHPVSYPVCVE